MRNNQIREITTIAIIAGLYVLLTIFNPIGYGIIQFRISEIILIMPFWNRKYIAPSILGVAIANIFSPLGFIDVVFGVLVAIISYTIIIRFKSKIINIILYSILCGLIIGAMLYYAVDAPYIITAVSITLSQLVICTIGFVIFESLAKRNIII